MAVDTISITTAFGYMEADVEVLTVMFLLKRKYIIIPDPRDKKLNSPKDVS